MSHCKDIIVLAIALVLFACTENKDPIKTDADLKTKETLKNSANEAKPKDSTTEITEKKASSEQMPEKIETEPKKNSMGSPTKMRSISELWKTYKKAKDDSNIALEKGDIKNAVTNLKLAGECALELGRNDIAAWQFNNVGHYSIEEFKKRTGCDNKIRILATMSSGDEKESFLKETKELFIREISLVNQAETNLQRAQIIDDELEKGRRTEVIESNIEFVTWVKEFVQ